MIELRRTLVAWNDRALASLIAATLVGATLTFGGAVWWARFALGVSIVLMATAALARAALAGRVRINRSPLALTGACAVGLAAVQLAPLPAGVAARLSARAHEAYASAAGDPSGRSPATLDRPATIRWMAGASACLCIFGVVAHFTDRLGRLKLVWGSVVAAFGVCTLFGVVQVASGASGLYGGLVPGQSPAWAPSLADAQVAPGATRLRALGEAGGTGPWALARPQPAFAIGPLPGGPGAYLALAALALPLTLGLALQTLAPRGSREDLLARLSAEGGLARLGLLLMALLVGSTLTGLLGGPWLSLPIAAGLALAGLPATRGAGVRIAAPALTAAALLALIAGVQLGRSAGRPPGCDPLAESGWPAVRAVWLDAARIARDFPLIGSGMGSFAAVHPHYKTRDEASTTALSSLVQWWVEAGWLGLILLGAAAAWCLARLPAALRRVGSADRALATAMLGAVGAFVLFSAIHWTVELLAVALSACAVGGTWDRWLAGGTDLFVEQGLPPG